MGNSSIFKPGPFLITCMSVWVTNAWLNLGNVLYIPSVRSRAGQQWLQWNPSGESPAIFCSHHSQADDVFINVWYHQSWRFEIFWVHTETSALFIRLNWNKSVSFYYKVHFLSNTTETNKQTTWLLFKLFKFSKTLNGINSDS